MLLKHSPHAHQLLRKLLPERERIQFVPQNDEGKKGVCVSMKSNWSQDIGAVPLILQKPWRPQGDVMGFRYIEFKELEHWQLD